MATLVVSGARARDARLNAIADAVAVLVKSKLAAAGVRGASTRRVRRYAGRTPLSRELLERVLHRVEKLLAHAALVSDASTQSR